jgi:Fe-S-cluster-containing dehydrogenase component
MIAKKRFFLQNSTLVAEKCYICIQNSYVMKKRMSIVACLLALILLFGSCASSRSRALRKAERQLEQQEKQSKKQYKKAKEAHYKSQASKTKKMMKKDRRRAERMRRRQRSNPFF